jgi:hypothetical protein
MTEHRRKFLPLTALTGLAILTVLTWPSVGRANPQKMVANSQYESWAPFGIGASATLTMVEKSAAGAMIRDSFQTQTVTALSAEKLTLATQATMRVGGKEIPGTVTNIEVPALVPEVAAPPAGTQTKVVAPAPQSITVPAGTFDCTLTTVTATVTQSGQTYTTVFKTWTSDKVPGSVVKMVSKSSRPTGNTVMTYELIEYKLGKVPTPQKMVPNPEYAKWASFPAGATATYAHTTLDGAGVQVGNAVGVWTLDAVSADAATVSEAFTTSPGTPDEYTCTTAGTAIPAMVPAGSATGNPTATTNVVVASATEKIVVQAGTFTCRLTTTTTTVSMPGGRVGTIVSKEWTSDTVPGALVKSSSLVDVGSGKITTAMELIAFNVP